MGHPARQPLQYADYLQLEKETGTKHELLDGIAFAMAGGSPEHAALAGNVVGILRDALENRPCSVHSSDLRVRIEAVNTALYPDVSVVCDQRMRSPVDANVINPHLVVEVTSPSSEAYDRGEKAGYYRRIEALQAYVIVSHDREQIELYARTDGGWHLREATTGEQLLIPSLNISLGVDDVYRDPLGGSLARPGEVA